MSSTRTLIRTWCSVQSPHVSVLFRVSGLVWRETIKYLSNDWDHIYVRKSVTEFICWLMNALVCVCVCVCVCLTYMGSSLKLLLQAYLQHGDVFSIPANIPDLRGRTFPSLTLSPIELLIGIFPCCPLNFTVIQITMVPGNPTQKLAQALCSPQFSAENG